MTSWVLTIRLKTADAMVLYMNGLAFLVMPSVTPTVYLFTVEEFMYNSRKIPFLQPSHHLDDIITIIMFSHHHVSDPVYYYHHKNLQMRANSQLRCFIYHTFLSLFLSHTVIFIQFSILNNINILNFKYCKHNYLFTIRENSVSNLKAF